MRRLTALPAAVALLAALGPTAACAQPPSGADPQSPDHRYEALYAWAGEVAEGWSRTADRSQWTSGFVPLQELTSVEGDLGEAGRRALRAGWLRSAAALPGLAPPPGAVVYPTGRQVVALLSAAATYAQLDQGDPQPCASAPAAPPPQPAATDPNGAVSSTWSADCTAVVVTDATLGTTRLRTTRGTATVPAWRFRIQGTKAAVVRVAVAQPGVGEQPSPAATPNRPPDPGLVAAQQLTRIDGATLDYTLGVGACDEDITPIVAERPDVVVVGGGVRRSAGVCTDQLLIEPVGVTLAEPLGDRPVLDALAGQPLILTVR
jgi:hypothetical protein